MTARSPFDDLRIALGRRAQIAEEGGARIDLSRRERTGVPEVVYCPGKPVEQIARNLARLAAGNGRGIAARCTPDQAIRVQQLLDGESLSSEFDPTSSILIAQVPSTVRPVTGGRVGVLTAGSSDWPRAAESVVIAQEMGCEVIAFQDVGIAGIHRLVEPLESLAEANVDVIVVAAGMDGVLPGVVAGLIDLPIVALPISTGYGYGGEGIGAMTTMLQSCSPGLAVVNIDNGIGAGAMAGRIANRAASQRAVKR